MKFGLIYYDWNFATSGSNGGDNTFDQEGLTLSPSAFQGQMPSDYGRITGANTIEMFPGTLTMMNRRLERSWRHGIDYHVFDFYANAPGYPLNGDGGVWTGVNDGLQFYLASPNKKLVQFAIALVGPIAGTMKIPITTGNWGPIADQIAAYTADSQYALGPGGRAMIYFFWPAQMISDGLTLAMVDSLRTKVTTATGTDPLIIAMSPSGLEFASVTTLGLNGITQYSVQIAGPAAPMSVADYDLEHVAQWDAMNGNAGGFSFIPSMSLGWDPRAREAHSFWCDTLGAYCTPAAYTVRSSSAQIAARARLMLDYEAAHAARCNFGHGLIYSGNESTESGNLMEPHGNDGGMNYQAFSAEVERQREHVPAMLARGIAIESR